MVRNIFVVLSLLLIYACTEAEASRTRTRIRRVNGRVVISSGGAVPDPSPEQPPSFGTDRFRQKYSDWVWAYSGESGSYNGNSTWVDLGSENDNLTAEVATANSNNNVSTSFITSAPTGMVNKGIPCDADDSWFDTAALDNGISDDVDTHIRAIIKYDTLATNQYIFRYAVDATNFLEIRGASASIMGIRFNHGTSEAEKQITIADYDNEWFVLDIVLDVNDETNGCAAGADCAYYHVFIDGVLYASFRTTSAYGALTAGGSLDVCSGTGTTNFWSNDLLFLGMRFDRFGLYEHRDDMIYHGVIGDTPDDRHDSFGSSSWKTLFDGDTYVGQYAWLDGWGTVDTMIRTAGGGNATSGVSTDGLRNIGMSFDSAITVNGSGSGFTTRAASGYDSVADGSDHHARFIFRANSDLEDSKYLLNYSYDASNAFSLQLGTSDTLVVTSAFGAAAVSDTSSSIEEYCENSWCLIDIFWDDSGFVGQGGTVTVWVDGVAVISAESISTFTGLTGNGQLELLNTGNSAFPTNVTMAFAGTRMDTGEITLAQHTADALAIGTLDKLKGDYTWSHRYNMISATSTNILTDSDGSVNMTSGVGTGVSLDQDTGNLVNIGRNVDQAINHAAAWGGYYASAPGSWVDIADGEDVHLRAVVKIGVLTDNAVIFNYNDGSTDQLRLYIDAATDDLKFSAMYESANAGEITCASSTNVFSSCFDKWCLVDLLVDDQGGSSVATIYVNGTQHVQCNSATAYAGIDTGGSVYILNKDGTASDAADDFGLAFLAIRKDTGQIASGVAADAAALGLVTTDATQDSFNNWYVYWRSNEEKNAWLSGGSQPVTVTNDGILAGAFTTTSGMIDSAVGSESFDSALQFTADTNYCATTPSFSSIPDNTDYHARILFYRDAMAANDYFFQIVSGGNNSLGAYATTSNQIRFEFKANNATSYLCTSGTDLGEAGWYLVDFNMINSENDATPYGELFVNGKMVTCANGSVNYGAFAANPNFGLNARAGTCDLGTDNDIVFVGVRPGPITHAQHNSDVGKLGLSHP